MLKRHDYIFAGIFVGLLLLDYIVPMMQPRSYFWNYFRYIDIGWWLYISPMTILAYGIAGILVARYTGNIRRNMLLLTIYFVAPILVSLWSVASLSSQHASAYDLSIYLNDLIEIPLEILALWLGASLAIIIRKHLPKQPTPHIASA